MGFPGFRVAKLQALIMPQKWCLFCDTKCFRNLWKEYGCTSKAMHDAKAREDRERKSKMAPHESSKAGGIIWESAGKNKLYVPTKDDIGHILQVQVSAMDSAGKFICLQKTFSKVVLPVPPVPDIPRVLKADVQVPQAQLGTRLRVCSYNVLAEIYTNKAQYPHCPLWALSWNFRHQNLMREIKQFQADIYCLQEVQEDRFAEYFYPEMRNWGYEGEYKKKTRRNMGMDGKVDGCAVFFKVSRIRLLEKYVIEFNEAAIAMARGRNIITKISSPTEEQRNEALSRLLKDNVAQVMVFETIPERGEHAQRFCTCNTHIHWDPEFLDVKLWQTQMLVKELQKFVVTRHLPIILCGDFNSLPDSSVYEFLSTGALRTSHPDLAFDPTGIVPNAADFRHDLQLQSCFVAATGKEPDFTNYTDNFVGTIDYIFTTCDRLVTTSVYEIPSEKELRKHTDSSLPNPQYSSDHLPMCADIQFVDQSLGSMVQRSHQSTSHRRPPRF